MTNTEQLTVHDLVDLIHSFHEIRHPRVECLTVLAKGAVESFDSTRHESAGVLHHSNVHEHETCLRRCGIQAELERTNETEVVVLETQSRVLQTIVEQCVGACVLHEWHETSAVSKCQCVMKQSRSGVLLTT